MVLTGVQNAKMPNGKMHACCDLGVVQTKDLELSNPSKKAIAYIARLQGHSDFSVDASIVHIDAKVGGARGWGSVCGWG